MQCAACFQLLSGELLGKKQGRPSPLVLSLSKDVSVLFGPILDSVSQRYKIVTY